MLTLFSYLDSNFNAGFNSMNAFDLNNAFKTQQSSSQPNLLDDDILTPESMYGSQNPSTSNTTNNISGLTGDLNKGLERVALSLGMFSNNEKYTLNRFLRRLGLVGTNFTFFNAVLKYFN